MQPLGNVDKPLSYIKRAFVILDNTRSGNKKETAR